MWSGAGRVTAILAATVTGRMPVPQESVPQESNTYVEDWSFRLLVR